MAVPTQPSLLHPDIRRRVLHEENEVVVDEVRRHWITRVLPASAVVAGILLLGAMPALGPYWWLLLLAGLALAAFGFVRWHQEYMQRFVVTNMRVFRVHGILEQRISTMPINRILDISMRQPFWGQVLNYGHFVFETAAQDQGLRDIRFVGDPELRDRIIQRVITRSGARATAKWDAEIDGG